MIAQTRPQTVCQTGSLTVELVLLVPLLILFTIFAMALGRYEMARQEVIGAARSGADAAAIVASPPQAQQAANSASEPDLQPLGHACASPKILADTSQFVPGGFVRVTVSCRIDFSDLMMPGLPGSTVVRASQIAPIDPYRSVQ
jgi:Flp pilus assembly protein TadG